MSDRSVTFTEGGTWTWTWPERGVKENKVYITGCGGGGSGGAGKNDSYDIQHYDEYGWVQVWVPDQYGMVQVWVPDQYGMVWDYGSSSYVWGVTTPAHYENQWGIVTPGHYDSQWQVVTPGWIETIYYSNGGGGGEAGESKSATLVLSNTSSIGVTISGGVSFGSLFSCVAGNNGGNADSTNFGAGGSGGPGADGGTGSRSAGGGGGSSGISGYGSGGSGGWNGGSPSAGQQGFITISWDDGSYCYVMEGE